MFFFLVCITAPLNGVCADESSNKGMDHLAKSPRRHGQENGKPERYSLERICSHDVLQDGESNSPNGCNNKLKRKVVIYNYLLCPVFGYIVCMQDLASIQHQFR